MKFDADEVAQAKEIYAKAEQAEPDYRRPAYDSLAWRGNTATAVVTGEWRKYGAARPLLESTRLVLEPLEEYERDRWGPWPVEMSVTAS